MPYQYDEFENCLNQQFTLQLTDQSIKLQLISVEKHPNSDTVNGVQAFSAVFRGGNTVMLQQQTYPVEHDSLGSMQLFIVPIGPDEKGMRYEAVFA
mgnify:FL=1